MTDTTTVRRFAYTMMIAVAAAVALGRIFSAERVYEPHMHRDEKKADDPRGVWPKSRPEPTPMFGSNDRSRWATVRSLVDDGTYVVGRRDRQTTLVTSLNTLGSPDVLHAAVASSAGQQQRIETDTGIVFDPGWETIDKVMNPTTQEYYSSKPPLVPTMVAGEYWLLKKLFGWDIARDLWHVVGFILVTINVIPFILYLVLLARLVERFAVTDWAKLFLVAAACFGTLVTPFLNTFNNHTLGTFTTLFALYAALHIRAPGSLRDAALYVVAGLFAGFTVCNELPALAFAVFLGVILVRRSPVQAIALYGVAVLVPIAALLAMNYLALGQFRPAYSEFGGPWYEYEGSRWRVIPGIVRRGIDWAGHNGETKPLYALHLLVGHHGLFSLTPLFLLSLAGMGFLLTRKRKDAAEPSAVPWDQRWREVVLLTLALTVIVIGFYIYKSDNYGGVTNGPRWLMWLTPLYLLTMVPVVDALSRSCWGRWPALFLLGCSVFSASYSSWNPWRHPWIYDWMYARDWIAY